MKKTTKVKRVRSIKLKPFQGVMIRNKKSNTPWTKEIFSSTETAFRYFNSMCLMHNWEFDWNDFVCDIVSITSNKK